MAPPPGGAVFSWRGIFRRDIWVGVRQRFRSPLPIMERKTANDFDQELLDLYDYYVHGQIDRRTFLDRAAKYAVGGLTALALLEMLSPQYVLAAQVPKEDARVKT